MKSLLKYTKTHTHIHNGMQPENVYLPEAYFDISEQKQRLVSVSSLLSKSLKSIPKICTNKETKQEKHLPEAHEAAVE
jgi:hypothetical protein